MPLTRRLPAAALLSALAVASLAPIASASTHRFSAARDVTVSFEVPRSRTSGALVRFARNGVAIVQARGGTLTLRSSGGGTRRLAVPARGAARVRVELSADHGRARLTVGRRTATVTGRFVAEDAVAVSGARLRRLRIETGAVAPQPRGVGDHGRCSGHDLDARPRLQLSRRRPRAPPPRQRPCRRRRPRRRSSRPPACGTRHWPTTPRWTPPTPRSSRPCATRSRRTSPPDGARGSRRARPRRSTSPPRRRRPSACSSTRARGRSGCSRPSRPCRSRPTPSPRRGPTRT